MAWGVVWQVEASITGEGSFVITTRDPTATLTEYLSEPNRHVSYMSSLNDHIEIELDSMTLAGRTDPDRGPAQSIIVPETPRDTLHLRNKQLTLDISKTRLDFDDFVAGTKVTIAALQAQIAALNAVVGGLTTGLDGRVALLETLGQFLAVNVYTASQTIIIPDGARRAKVKMWGASGGSDGYSNTDFYHNTFPTGAGGYVEKLLDGLVPGGTLVFTFGARGLAGAVATSGTPGTDGGNSVLASGTQIIATLTAGGSPHTGAGGTATGGDINLPGAQAIGGYNNAFLDGNLNTVQVTMTGTPGRTMYSLGAFGNAHDGADGGLIIEWYSGHANPLNLVFTGVGNFIANAERLRPNQQLAYAEVFRGSGGLACDVTRRIAPGLSIAGSGSSLVADAIRMIGPGSTILGSGSLACSAFIPPR